MHTMNLIESAESSDSLGFTILTAIHDESSGAVKLVSEHFTARLARLLLLGRASSSQKCFASRIMVSVVWLVPS
jgi:hypothetical protein